MAALARSFDRTYEGLKHGSLRPPSGCGGSFDRTYEGLKPTRLTSGSHPSASFDRTYEGLKLLLAAVLVEPFAQF